MCSNLKFGRKCLYCVFGNEKTKAGQDLNPMDGHRNRENQNLNQGDQTKEDGEIIEGRGKCRLHRMYPQNIFWNLDKEQVSSPCLLRDSVTDGDIL